MQRGPVLALEGLFIPSAALPTSQNVLLQKLPRQSYNKESSFYKEQTHASSQDGGTVGLFTCPDLDWS